MVAAVDTMAWLRAEGAPWHDLGTVMETNPVNGREAMIMAGLDWEVVCNKVAVLVSEGQPFMGKSLGDFYYLEPDHAVPTEVQVVSSSNQMILRGDTGAQLGIVGSKYEPMQNVDAFDFFDSALGVGKAQYVTAGALKRGKIVWALVRLPGVLQVGKDDPVGKYLLLTTAHDGTMAVWLTITPIRVVCWNTLQAAFANSQTMARFWHTKGLNKRMFDYAEQLGRINETFEKTEKAFQALAEYQVTPKQVETFIETLFPIPEEIQRPGKMQAIRKQVLDNFEGFGLGSNLNTAKGTAWGLYNAVGEYVDHSRGTTQEARLQASWFGAGATLKEDALRLSLETISA